MKHEDRGAWNRICRARLGVCFSDFAHDVVCVDNKPEKIAMLERGEVRSTNSGLTRSWPKNVEAWRLNFTMDLAKAIDGVQAVGIAVGTPIRAHHQAAGAKGGLRDRVSDVIRVASRARSTFASMQRACP